MFTSQQSYGSYLRDLRLSRGMSQGDLAQITGIAQPNLSAYENDRRQPTLDAFNRIVVACGYQLVAEGATRQLPCPLPVAGWFPDEDLPPRLPGDPVDVGPPPAVGLTPADRGDLVHEVLRLADAVRR